MKNKRSFITAILLAVAPSILSAADITVQTGKWGAAISPQLYGIFFEEISRGGDGGIYAEMLQNRSFEDAAAPVGWTLIQEGGAQGKMELDKATPLNAKNTTSLRLEISGTGRVGIANQGFKGAPELPKGEIAVWLPKFEKGIVQEKLAGLAVGQGKAYLLTFYARTGNGFNSPLSASLEKQDGTVLASQKVTGMGTNWAKYECSLTASETEPDARLVLSASDSGTVWFDMVSLFPRDTWKGRPNGLRKDLMEMIEAMKPGFVRFPGGSYVNGDKMEDAYRWKETIGPVEERPGHFCCWGYRSTDGLGFHEYLQMCEDLGAEPMYVTNAGIANDWRKEVETVPLDKMNEWVQEVLDAIEYANGPVTTKYGALRAKAGHPAPFNMKYIEIGNENGTGRYNDRYPLFYNAIKQKYPDFHVIACDWRGLPTKAPVDIADEHDYSTPEWFLQKATHYDSYDRAGRKIYVGEYAVTTGVGRGNLRAAVAESAFMTGMERNSDVVILSSYAPLLVRDGWEKWNPNAIHFDASRIFGTPSYYAQALFANNRPDINLPVSLAQTPAELAPPTGRIGVGTWGCQAEFKDFLVTQEGKVLFQGDLLKGTTGWTLKTGQWAASSGVLQQSSEAADCRALAGGPTWGDYTYSLKFRKTAGKGGVQIMFHAPENRHVRCLNLGGADNSTFGVEVSGLPMKSEPGSLETGRWYEVRIELKGIDVKCYLDGKLIQEANVGNPPTLYAVAGRKQDTIILKTVNASNSSIQANISLDLGGAQLPGGTITQLTSASSTDENTFLEPTKVAPVTKPWPTGPSAFSYNLPPNSLTIWRFEGK